MSLDSAKRGMRIGDFIDAISNNLLGFGLALGLVAVLAVLAARAFNLI